MKANLTDGQGSNPDASGYTPGTKSYVLNTLHCMLQELQESEFDFDLAFGLIESVRDSIGE